MTTETLRHKLDQYLKGVIQVDEFVTILSQFEFETALKGMSTMQPTIEFASMNIPLVKWTPKP